MNDIVRKNIEDSENFKELEIIIWLFFKQNTLQESSNKKANKWSSQLNENVNIKYAIWSYSWIGIRMLLKKNNNNNKMKSMMMLVML